MNCGLFSDDLQQSCDKNAKSSALTTLLCGFLLRGLQVRILLGSPFTRGPFWTHGLRFIPPTWVTLSVRRDLLVGLFDPDGPAGEHLAEIDLLPIEADASAGGDGGSSIPRATVGQACSEPNA